MLFFHSIDCVEVDNVLYYNFQVQFGSRHNWVIQKTYNDFSALHQDLVEKYGTEAPPKLVSFKSRLWNRNKKASGDECLPRLEEYLQEVAASCDSWYPPYYKVKVPHPEGKGRPHVTVIQSLFDFCELDQYMLVPGCDDEPPAVAAVESPLTSARSDNNKSSTTDEASNVSAPQSTRRIEATLLPPMHQSKMDSQQLALAASASNITSQIGSKVKNFTIYKQDRIDYHIHVTLCGHHWTVSKRYSELENLHERLRALYGKENVPSIRDSRVVTWKKLDQKTGHLRQRFFDDYLREVILSIDSWDPKGLLTSFELEKTTGDGLRTVFSVSVNQFLFEFFDFESHVEELSGEDVERAVEEQQSGLSAETQIAFAKKKISERRSAMHSVIQKQAKHLVHATRDEIDGLLFALSELRDDRDILRLFEHYLVTGDVENDISKLDHSRSPRIVSVKNGSGGNAGTNLRSPPHGKVSNVMSSGADSPYESPRTPRSNPAGNFSAMTSRRFIIDKDMCNSSLIRGITSQQLLTLVEPIAFNDTKIAVIKLFTPALVNIDDLQQVFDVLWYNWDVARAEVEALLLAE